MFDLHRLLHASIRPRPAVDFNAHAGVEAAARQPRISRAPMAAPASTKRRSSPPAIRIARCSRRRLPASFSRPMSLFAMCLNDALDDELRQELLMRFVTRLAGSADTPGRARAGGSPAAADRRRHPGAGARAVPATASLPSAAARSPRRRSCSISRMRSVASATVRCWRAPAADLACDHAADAAEQWGAARPTEIVLSAFSRVRRGRVAAVSDHVPPSYRATVILDRDRLPAGGPGDPRAMSLKIGNAGGHDERRDRRCFADGRQARRRQARAGRVLPVAASSTHGGGFPAQDCPGRDPAVDPAPLVTRAASRMFESLEAYGQQVVEFVSTHEAWAAPVVFALAFGESLAFISLLIPAWAALVGIGVLIASGGLNFWPIWVAGALGAALGDWLSYWIGVKLGPPVAHIWPLSRHPDLIPRGEALREELGRARHLHRPLLRAAARLGAAGRRHLSRCRTGASSSRTSPRPSCGRPCCSRIGDVAAVIFKWLWHGMLNANGESE